MVQIVNVDPKPSVWAAIGQGLGSGISEGAKSGLSYKLQDMYDQKKSARAQAEQGSKGLAVLKMLRPEASQEEQAVAYALGGEMTMKLLENLGDSGFANFVASKSVPMGEPQAQRPQSAEAQSEQPANVLGQPKTQNINIQGMPKRQPSQPQPPFMLPEQAQKTQEQPTRQQPEMPKQLTQKAAEMSDEAWSNWLARQPLSNKVKLKYSAERDKQREFALKERADARAEREEVRKEALFQREISDAPQEVKPYVAKIAAARSKNEQADKALKFAEMAVESGEASGLMQYYASVRGIEPLKTMDTALLDAASKDFLTSTIGGIGSKANMWLEKQIRSQFPVAGSQTDANKARLEVLKTQHDISKKEVELFDKLSDEDRQKYGAIQHNIQRRVDDQLKEFSTYRMNKAAVNIQELRDSKRTQKQLSSEKVAKGTPLTQSRVNALWSRFHDKEKIEDYVAKAGFEKYDTRAKK